MPNEFVARLGLISRQDSQITGSLRVTGSIIVTGSVLSSQGFTGSLLGTASFANAIASITAGGVEGSVQYNASNTVTGGSNLILTTGTDPILNLSGSATAASLPTIRITSNVPNTNTGGQITFSSGSGTTYARISAGINGNIGVITFATRIVGAAGTTPVAQLNTNGFEMLQGGFTGSLSGTASIANLVNFLGLAIDSNYPVAIGGITPNQPAGLASYLGLTFNPVTNRLIVSQSVSASSFTGSLFGTASYVSGNVFTSQNPVLTASFAQNSTTASLANAVTVNSFVLDNNYRIAVGGLATGQNALSIYEGLTFNPVTNRLFVSQSVSASSFTGSLFGTSSWASNVLTASFITTAQTASFVTLAQTASFVTLAQTASFVTLSQTASFVATASWARNAITSSFIITAQTASFVTLAQTASYVLNAVSSSFATTSSFSTTASFASNGGVTQIIAGANISLSPTTGVGAVTITSTGAGGSAFPFTGSAIISGSLNVISHLGPSHVTGTFIVSGANGAGIFSQGATIADFVGGISNTGSYMVWRAPFSCSVVAMYGYREGGGAAKVNALRSGSSGTGLISASDLSLRTSSIWMPFIGTLQNTTFNAGDSLRLIMSGSASNSQLGVQVDFIRKF